MAENRPERIAGVVVTYNRKRLLGECIDSLLRQNRPLDALYIIDNGSTDGTGESLLGAVYDKKVAAEAGGSGKAEGLADGERANHRQAAACRCHPRASRVRCHNSVIHPLGEQLMPPPIQPCEVVRTIPLPQSPGKQLEMHYVRMPENTGGAGGFAEGMKRAAGAGFDWLWLMDDDVVTAPEALDALVRKTEELKAAGEGAFILNSLVLARDQADGDSLAFPLRELSAGGSPRRGAFHWRLSEVQDKVHDGLYRWICPFNGTLMPARVVEQVGLPRREFFIYGDETDFQFRAAKTFRLYTAVDSRVYHPRQRPGAFDWKQYYNIRNMFIVNRHFDHRTLRNLKLVLTGLAMGLRHGRRATMLMLRAIRDGLTGQLGKRDDLAS